MRSPATREPDLPYLPLAHKVAVDGLEYASAGRLGPDAVVLEKAHWVRAAFYTVAHNQSGVTPDSLRFGVPVIVSEFDAFAAEIVQHKAGIVLRREEIGTETVAQAVREIRANLDEYAAGATRLFDCYFGESGFRRYWMPLLSGPKG
jgi:glycosyltransferase involved in cell wall biosynthesis